MNFRYVMKFMFRMTGRILILLDLAAVMAGFLYYIPKNYLKKGRFMAILESEGMNSAFDFIVSIEQGNVRYFLFCALLLFSSAFVLLILLWGQEHQYKERIVLRIIYDVTILFICIAVSFFFPGSVFVISIILLGVFKDSLRKSILCTIAINTSFVIACLIFYVTNVYVAYSSRARGEWLKNPEAAMMSMNVQAPLLDMVYIAMGFIPLFLSALVLWRIGEKAGKPWMPWRTVVS